MFIIRTMEHLGPVPSHDDQNFIRSLIATPSNDPNFQNILGSLSLVSLAELLEYVLFQRKSTGQTNDFFEAVISASQRFIFQVLDPTGESIILHTLSPEGHLRILKMSEGVGWRNVNQYENAYHNLT